MAKDYSTVAVLQAAVAAKRALQAGIAAMLDNDVLNREQRADLSKMRDALAQLEKAGV